MQYSWHTVWAQNFSLNPEYYPDIPGWEDRKLEWWRDAGKLSRDRGESAI